MGALVCVTALLSAPLLLLASRDRVLGIAKWWARANLALLKAVVGIDLEVRGRENIPKGAAIVAVKHQSALETFSLMPLLPDAAFVLKRELMLIPLFGWFLARLDMIAINRAAGGEALVQMLEQADVAARAGRQIVIYPEGTRRAVGAPPVYKAGASILYDRAKIPCVPVAIDTGVFWPRDTLKRRQGRAVISFLAPIEPGLPREVFERILRERIEAESDALAAEAR